MNRSIFFLAALLFFSGAKPTFQEEGFQDLYSQLLSQNNTYFEPNAPGEPHLVKVQILIQDSPEQGGLQIVSAEFDGHKIPLKPRDIHGNRGSGSFQVVPGRYKLRWVVNRSKLIWPRQISREDIVEISPRDLWLQISIVGEDATIL